MDKKEISHVPFRRLPIEACALFYFFSLSAMEYHCNSSHTSAEIFTDLEMIWNIEQLTPDDLQNWDRMSDLLIARLPKCAPEDLLLGKRDATFHRTRRK